MPFGTLPTYIKIHLFRYEGPAAKASYMTMHSVWHNHCQLHRNREPPKSDFVGSIVLCTCGKTKADAECVTIAGDKGAICLPVLMGAGLGLS